MIKAVRRLLEPDCEIVGTVADGAVLLAEAQRLRPDVIVLDLSLPTVSGLDACRRIRETDPDIHVIILTASGDPETEQQALAAGAVAYISKLSSIELIPLIKRLFASSRPAAS